MMNEQVRHIMTRDPIALHPTDLIAKATSLLTGSRLHHLPVVDEKNVLVGMVTTYDLWNNMASNKSTISEIMSTNMIKITPVDKVGTAAELFLDKRFHALPVVNLDGVLKGMVTSFDVLKYTFKKEYKVPILYQDELAEAV